MHTIALAVLSLDGCLTRHDEEGISYASPEDQDLFRETLRHCRAVVMGRKTFDAVRERILSSPPGETRRFVVTGNPAAYAGLQQPGRLEFVDLTPAALLQRLTAEGFEKCALVGGCGVFDAFAAADLIDEWWLTFEPRLFGRGKRMLSAPLDPRLRRTHFEALNEGTFLVKYAVER